MSWQILNSQGNDAGTDDGRLAIFEEEQDAKDWAEEYLSDVDYTIRRVTFNDEDFVTESPYIRIWCPETGSKEVIEEETPGNKDMQSAADWFAEEHDLHDGAIIHAKRRGEDPEYFKVRQEIQVIYNVDRVKEPDHCKCEVHTIVSNNPSFCMSCKKPIKEKP